MSSLKSQIESLLFISNQPFSLKKLASITKSDKTKVGKALDELTEEYNAEDKGIGISKIDDKVQMVTGSGNAQLVADYIKEETTGELSRAALETLTIIAYRGPVAKAELEQIRGVNCSVILRNLQMRGLVEGKDDKKKMQSVYNITFDFLKFLGLSGQSDLPDYEKLNSSSAIEKILDNNPQEKEK